jgi:hypothetical protein
MDLETLQRALGGDISNGQLLCPGPGHSPADRSLSIKLDSNMPDGFVVHSFAGDDPINCKVYIREKAGLPAFVPKAKKGNGNGKWTFISEHIYRTEMAEPYLRVRKYHDENNKKQYPQAHWHDRQWVKGKPAGAKIPYRLPELIAAAPTTQIFFTEGEKDADTLAKLGFVATTASEGAAAKWDDALTHYFKDKHVVILPHADVPGRAHAQKVAKAINNVAASVRVIDLYPGRQDGSDAWDWVQDDTAGSKLAAMAKNTALLWEPTPDDDKAAAEGRGEADKDEQIIAALAALPKLAYEKQREEAAKQLEVRVSILDKLVKAARVEGGDDDSDTDDLGKKQADVLVALAREASLFHTPARDGYADIVVNGHRETHKIRSRSFRAWLTHRYFKERDGAPSSEAMHSALGVIEARALFEGDEMSVQVRVAGHDGKLYLDLADEQWRAVEIDADGWRIVLSPPVRFRRAPGMLSLRQPIAGGSIEMLRPFLNVDTDEDFKLRVAWALGALRDSGPYPVLALAGEQGTAKSSETFFLRSLIDPNTAPLRALPREDRDLFIAANNSHILAFDNVSGLPPWISDTLCRLATGGGFATRLLFSDDAEILFDAMRPIILNGIEDVATRPDLADRSVVLVSNPIPEDKRRAEKELRAAFREKQPFVLGALLDAAAHGLRVMHNVELRKLPRMADFAIWITACEPALGWQPGGFMDAYEANRTAALGTTIEADLVATAVTTHMENRQTWTGTASLLLDTLGLLITEAQRRSKAWPSLPHHLTGRLRRIAPVLRKIGIEVTFNRDATTRDIVITRGEPENTGGLASSTSSTSLANNSNGADMTLTDQPASSSASLSGAGVGVDDAPHDAPGRARVMLNPLETQQNDAHDAHDARSSSLSGPPSERVCAQCRGVLDDTEAQYEVDGKTVWLHPECLRFYRERVYR